MGELLSTHQVAKLAKVHRDTLLRWLREGRVHEPGRDRNGWRAFTPSEANSIVAYARGGTPSGSLVRELNEEAAAYGVDSVAKLRQLDWDFADAGTSYLTHSLHPYPAKFIPQIPNTLIQELSSVGDTVLDPFCGSGTTLVESLLLRRRAIGIDANPLACLIARAKTTRLGEPDVAALRHLEYEVSAVVEKMHHGALPLFSSIAESSDIYERPQFDGLDFWFEPHVIDELTKLRAMCKAVATPAGRDLALVAFSSIIVAVSRQDSDTRYVRRDKHIHPGDTTQRFLRALSLSTARAIEFSEMTEAHLQCQVVQANVLDRPAVAPVDLIVCSPPYPNAFSYHLYHRTRMLWLEMDQPTFKKVEIGSHRKYSKKTDPATAETFASELSEVLVWLHPILGRAGHACFVLGDSVLKGTLIHNDELLMQAAKAAGYRVEANLSRHLLESRKSFNPAIGKIKNEHVVILSKAEA